MALDLGNLSARMTLDSSQYTTALQKAGAQTTSSMAEMKGFMLQALGVAGATGLFIKAGQSAMAFGAEMANIASIADDLDKAKIARGLLELNSVYGSSTDLAKAFYQTYSAGIRGTEEELVKLTESISSLSRTVLSDQATTVQAVTSIMNAYGLAVGEATEVMDMFFQTVKLGKTTGPELASSLGQVVNSASIAKLSLNELGASIATLTRTMPTAVAVTSLNQAILAFIQPTKEALDVAKQFGIELSATALQQKGFAKAIQEINDKAGDNVEALALMFGNVRSFRAVASLASNQAEVFQDVLSQFESKGGSQLSAFGRATDSLEATWHHAMVEMEKAFIKLGDSLAPTIATIAHAIESIAQAFRGLDSQDIVSALGVAIAFVAIKVNDMVFSMTAFTKVVVQSTIATTQNTQAQVANATAFGMVTKTITSAGTAYNYHIVSLQKQQGILAKVQAGIGGVSSAMGLLIQAYVAFETGKFFFNMTKSFMENTEAGQKLAQGMGDVIFAIGKQEGAYKESKVDPALLTKRMEQDMTAMTRWKDELSKTDLAGEATKVFAEYNDAVKSGSESGIRHTGQLMRNLVKSIRPQQAVADAIEATPPYKMEIQDIVNVGGISGEVSRRLLEMTETEFAEFKSIAEKRFGTDNLFRISPSNYSKIFSMQDFEKAFESQKKEFEDLAEKFGFELQQVSVNSVLNGQTALVSGEAEYDIIVSQRAVLLEQIKSMEEERLAFVNAGLDEEVLLTQKAMEKRLQMYNQLGDREKELDAQLSEMANKDDGLTGQDVIGKQVQEAGGLANIRKTILGADVGGDFKAGTIDKYMKTLDQGQRAEYEGLVTKFKAGGAGESQAQTSAVIVMQRNLERQAKIDQANSTTMIDLLQQMNDFFKDGSTLVLQSP